MSADPTEVGHLDHYPLNAGRCMGLGCEAAAAVLIVGLDPRLAICEHPVRLCVEHAKTANETLDVFRWLTDGRVSADPE